MITSNIITNRCLYEQYYRIGYGHAVGGERFVCLPLNKAARTAITTATRPALPDVSMTSSARPMPSTTPASPRHARRRTNITTTTTRS